MTAEAGCQAELVVTDAPTAQAEAVIGDGLSGYNSGKAGFADACPLAVLLKHPGAEQIAGGLLGRTSYGLLFIELVFLPAWGRGRGLGSRVLAAAETEARRRGCTAAVLYTITFQAPGFYARHGYHELGRIGCEPPGHARICMTKRLAAGQAGHAEP